MGKQSKKNTSEGANNGCHYSSVSESTSVRPLLWSRPWLPDIQLSAMITMATLSLYLKTLHPSVPGGDSGELITSAYEAGVAHPPGYPLFTMAAKLIIELLPMSTPAWRVNFLNAVFSSIASGLLMLAATRLTGQWSSGLLAVALFSLSHLTWKYSVTAEVFALNNVFIGALLCLMIWFETCRGGYKIKACRWGAFVCGLSLCNQHTIIVYVMFVIIWALSYLTIQQRLTVRVLFEVAGCFVCGLLPYLYLPISAHLRVGRWTWGDQTTFNGFLTHVLRQEYGSFSLALGGDETNIFQFLRAYFQQLMDEFIVAGAILPIIGIFIVWKRFRQGDGSCMGIMLLMSSVYLLLFAWRSNLDLTNPLYYGVVERFWLQSNFIVAVIAAVAYDEFSRYLSDLFRRAELARCLIPCLVLLFQVHRNWSDSDQSGNLVVYEFGKTILDSMPPHAIILTKGDLPSNVLRPDVQVFDQEILTYPWSLPMLRKSYYKLRFPGDVFYKEDGLVHTSGGISFTFKSLLDDNYDRHPIFGCIGVQAHEPSWQQTYELWPFGVCSKFVRKGTELQPEAWAKLTGNFAMHWAHPYQKFDPTSWEKVANDEMWNAKVSTANMMYGRGEKLGYHSAQSTPYLLQAYKLYLRAMDNNPEYPVFWRKNFALVCQLLIYAPSHTMDRVSLIDETIRQFTLYLDETPAEEDASLPDIKTAINTLHNYRNTLLSNLG